METEKQVKATIMDDAALGRALTRIAHEILERNRGAENVALIGIRRPRCAACRPASRRK